METKLLLDFHTSTHLRHVRTGIDQSINLVNPHWGIYYWTNHHPDPHTLKNPPFHQSSPRSIHIEAIMVDPPQATRELFLWRPPLDARAQDCRTTVDEIWGDNHDMFGSCIKTWSTCIWLHICGTPGQSRPRQTWPTRLSCGIKATHRTYTVSLCLQVTTNKCVLLSTQETRCLMPICHFLFLNDYLLLVIGVKTCSLCLLQLSEPQHTSFRFPAQGSFGYLVDKSNIKLGFVMN